MTIRILTYLTGFCFAAALSAASVTEVQFPELVDEAERIAVGTVRDIKTTHDGTEGGAPLTRVRFESLRWWKGGDDERTITLEFLGGKMPDGTVIHVVGMPDFRVGEEHLIFWKDGQRYINPLVGWWQGYYKVEVNQAGQSVVQWPKRMAPDLSESDGDVSDGEVSNAATLSRSQHSHTPAHTDSSRHTLSASLAAHKGDEPVEEVAVDLIKQRVLFEMTN